MIFTRKILWCLMRCSSHRPGCFFKFEFWVFKPLRSSTTSPWLGRSCILHIVWFHSPYFEYIYTAQKMRLFSHFFPQIPFKFGKNHLCEAVRGGAQAKRRNVLIVRDWVETSSNEEMQSRNDFKWSYFEDMMVSTCLISVPLSGFLTTTQYVPSLILFGLQSFW